MSEQSSFLVGIPTETIWSSCSDLSSGALKLILAITTIGPDASSAGKLAIAEFANWLKSDPTIEEAQRKLTAWPLAPDCQLVVWFEREGLSLFATNDGLVGVIRQGKYFQILRATQSLQVVSGTVHESDTLFFGTQAFASRVLSNSLQTPNLFSHQSTEPDMCAYLRRSLLDLHEEPTSVVSEKSKDVIPRRAYSARTFWLHVSPAYKKLLSYVIVVGVVLIGIALLQRFILSARDRRISGATAPLSKRLSAIEASTVARMEKEKQLDELVRDTNQAKVDNSSDPAIESKLEVFSLNLNSVYEQISKQRHIDHLPVFYDFRLISTDFVASEIQFDLLGKLAIFLDTARGKLVSLSLEKKQPQALSLNSDVGKLLSLTIVDRKAYVLGKAGIYEVSLPLDTEGKVVASASADWQSPERIGSFGTNVYVFDSQSRQIFRYDRGDFSSSPSAWLRGKGGVDLDTITSLSIDGDVWAGTSTGTLYRFTRGDRSQFSYQDIVHPPESSIALYTANLSNNLYVLEPRASRLVVFDKTGVYQYSIVCPDFAASTSLIVDEDTKRAYVLAGSLVYEVEL